MNRAAGATWRYRSLLMFIFFQANVATRHDILVNFFLAYVAKIVATSSSRPIFHLLSWSRLLTPEGEVRRSRKLRIDIERGKENDNLRKASD